MDPRDPASEQVADERGECGQTGRDAPDPARAELVGQRAGHGHAEAEDRVVRAHQHGEHAPAQAIGRAPLDQQRIADDRGAVAQPGDDDADGGDPDVGSDGRSSDADRHHPKAGDVDARELSPLDESADRETADEEADSGACEHEAETEVARLERDLGEHDLGDVDSGDPEHAHVPRDEHRQQGPGAANQCKAFPHVAPVTLRRGMSDLEEARRDPKDQRRREEEGDRVDRVGPVRARCGDEDAAGERAEHGRHRVGRLEHALRARQLRVLDEVRQSRVDRRAEETGCEPGDRSQHDDLGRALRKRERAEDEEANDVRGDHHAAPREAVDERAHREAEHDRGQEVGDQQRAHPGAGARPVPDVDRQRDEREPGAQARAESGKEEQAEPTDSAEQVDLRTEEAVRDSVEDPQHDPAGD